MKTYQSIVNEKILHKFSEVHGCTLMNHVANSYDIEMAIGFSAWRNSFMTKLFGKYKRDGHDRECIENVPDPQTEPMEILITGKGSIDIVYKRKKAKFYGELGISGFRAVTGSMRWMEPEKDAPVSEEDREEWVKAIMNHPENSRARVYFVDDREDDLKRAEDYWNKKEYKKAEVLFDKHFESLTKIQIKKLEYIKKYYSDKC